MGFLSGLFSGEMGAGFRASGTNIQQPATSEQAQQAYGQSQSGLSQQQQFINALGAQGGIGNQADVFQQQQALANMLNQQAQGGGPNPALAQLQATTGQNVAQQASLMGSQRGAGANVGLIGRQAAMQGANIQQNAAGQAAVLRAQQQLAAQQALQQQQNMMGGLAGQQVGQQANALQFYNQAAQGQQNSLYNAIGQQNQANVGMQSNINNANAGIAAGNQRFQAGLVNNVLSGIGNALAGPGAAAMSDGGTVPNAPANGPQSFVGKFLNDPQMAHSGMKVPGRAHVSGDSRKNDTVPAMLSPGEIVIPRSAASNPDKAAAFARAVVMRNGGRK